MEDMAIFKSENGKLGSIVFQVLPNMRVKLNFKFYSFF